MCLSIGFDAVLGWHQEHHQWIELDTTRYSHGIFFFDFLFCLSHFWWKGLRAKFLRGETWIMLAVHEHLCCYHCLFKKKYPDCYLFIVFFHFLTFLFQSNLLALFIQRVSTGGSFVYCYALRFLLDDIKNAIDQQNVDQRTKTKICVFHDELEKLANLEQTDFNIGFEGVCTKLFSESDAPAPVPVPTCVREWPLLSALQKCNAISYSTAILICCALINNGSKILAQTSMFFFFFE